MKYHRTHRQQNFNSQFDLVEEVISAIRERFSKSVKAHSQEVHYDDNTTLPFVNGQLLQTIEAQRKKGISAESVDFTLVHIYKGNQGRTRLISFQADSQYSTLSLSVTASGNQADLDWGKASYESLSQMLTKIFPMTPLRAQKSKLKPAEEKRIQHFNIDWKWVVGTIIGLVTIVIGYLQLRNM
jgi:hypothetical protein